MGLVGTYGDGPWPLGSEVHAQSVFSDPGDERAGAFISDFSLIFPRQLVDKSSLAIRCIKYCPAPRELFTN